jgi:hypothetical protein
MLNTKSISIDSIVYKMEDFISTNMDNEKVLMSIKNNKYYNLGQIGGVIWDQINSPVSVADLVTILIEIYDVTYAECKEHVINFLELLAKEGLIHIK